MNTSNKFIDQMCTKKYDYLKIDKSQTSLPF